MSRIRQIGEDILHTPPKPFDWSTPKRLDDMLKIMKRNLYEAGGVGIAANQCAEIDDPMQVVIVGINNEKIREKAAERYPERDIPVAMVMVNPSIKKYSGEVYYPGEGCLSVAGTLRGCAKRYTEVVVEYDDEVGRHHKKTFSGFIAHIIQHECDHLKGIVYLQKIINELSLDQKTVLIKCLEEAKTIEAKNSNVVEKPHFVFEREGDKVIFVKEELVAELLKLPKATLAGIAFVCRKLTVER